MALLTIELTNFRIFETLTFTPDPEGTTVILGPNGTGKTSILEGLAYLGTARSLRGSTKDAMVRLGQDTAYVRAELVFADRHLQVEAAIARHGRSRLQVNRQHAKTRRDLADAVPVTSFCPEDIDVVRGGPGGRRDVLDDALSLLEPTAGALIEDVERILRQRGALLRQAKGRLNTDIAGTLDIWDERLSQRGAALADLRERLSRALHPEIDRAYRALAGATSDDELVGVDYLRSWNGELSTALEEARSDDVRRGVSTVGPHRDDLWLAISGRDARNQASQGEQRCLALALRLAVHRHVSALRGFTPILLLDDVFSELDPERSTRLIAELPSGQTLITTASPLPGTIAQSLTVQISDITGG